MKNPASSRLFRAGFMVPLAMACLASPLLAATVVNYDVRTTGHPDGATLTTFSSGGGSGPNFTRHGLATTTTTGTNPRVVAGTSSSTVLTITGAGTITMTYFLDNTVNAAFQPGLEGLYDAGSGLAASAAGVLSGMQSFNALSGVSAVYTGTLPDPDASNNIPASLQTITYTIADGSDAIGTTVAFGFHSTWSNAGAYIFGDDAGANEVTLTFTPIPEPTAALLGGMGLLAMLRRRRA